MRTTVLYFFIFVLIRCPYFSTAKNVKERIQMKYKGAASDAKTLGEHFGLTYKGSVLGDDSHLYLFTSNVFLNIEELKTKAKGRDKNFKAMTKEEPLDIYPRVVTINDPEWSNQWHLQTAQTPGMKVYAAWDKGFNGSGVKITFLDDGIDTDNLDLAANYDSSLSYDIVNDVSSPSHKDAGQGHGTSCAGVAAAVKNDNCVIGTAYEATIGGLRILDDQTGVTASEVAMALTYALSDVDIYSNSWGPSDNGYSFSDISSVEHAAFEEGVTQGRGGLGAIYTWASGNGGWNSDDCNADGYAKSIYTIAVAAVSETTAPTWYSEHCSAILTATYSGDDPNKQITTTAPSDACVGNFSGTSSACPVASGIVALTLQANSSLSWRDVQHLIVETAISSGLHANASFSTNAAGKEFSHYFGFGLMNAEAMVDSAQTWPGVPAYTTCTYPEVNVDRYSFHTTITETFTVDNCSIAYLEFVEVEIDYSGWYRGDVQFELVSPLGTTSIIFSRRIYDQVDMGFPVKTTFMTVHFWGEDPAGDWTLNMIDMSPFENTDMNLTSWRITVYGTITDPLSGAPAQTTTTTTAPSTTSTPGSTTTTTSSTPTSAQTTTTTTTTSTTTSTTPAGSTTTTSSSTPSSAQTTTTTTTPSTSTSSTTTTTTPAGSTITTTSSTPTSERQSDDSDDSNNAGLVAVAVICGVAAVALLGGGGFFIYTKFIQPKGRIAPTAENPAARPNAVEQPYATHFQQSQHQPSQTQAEPPQAYNFYVGHPNPVYSV